MILRKAVVVRPNQQIINKLYWAVAHLKRHPMSGAMRGATYTSFVDDVQLFGKGPYALYCEYKKLCLVNSTGASFLYLVLMSSGAGVVLEAESATKRVILIRHAESRWNEWRKRTSICNGDLCCCVFDPGMIDPGLSSRGHRQCEQLRMAVDAAGLQSRVELVVCSPLSRALDTCEAAFASSGIPVVVTALHRERLDSWGDTGTATVQLRERYKFDFTCQSLQSEHWWNDPEGGHGVVRAGTQPKENPKVKESFAALERRCARFRQWLLAREESCIAIVGHSTFFRSLLRENSKMRNCELVEAIVTQTGVRRVRPGRHSRA